MDTKPFRCLKCKKSRPRIVGVTKICYRCQLFGVLLMQAYKDIISHSDMVEFDELVSSWYLNDA